MALPGTGKCHHCELPGHWLTDCPLLKPPDGRKEHDARIAEFTRRFVELEIGPVAKKRMIEKENSMEAKRKREMARR